MVNICSPPLHVGDELYVYYGGAKNHHDWWLWGLKEGLDVPEATDMSRVSYCLGLAKMKVDRYVSLSAGAVREGVLITKPFYAEGGKLLLNARCEVGGYVQVAVADGEGKILAGFEREKSAFFQDDDIARQFAWGDKRELPEGWLKLHFYMKNADLYTFRLQQ